MTSDQSRSLGDQLDLVFDACVITMGLFSLVTAAELGVTAALGGAALPGWLEFFSSGLVLATAIGGPILAWWLHGRRFTWMALLGGFLGALIVGALALSSQWVAIPLTWLISPVSTADSAGPIALLTVLGAVVIVVIVWQLVDAVRDIFPARRVHVVLDILRVVSVIGIVSLRFVVNTVIQSNATGEIGEALVLALIVGVAGAAMVGGAELLTVWAERRSATHAHTPWRPPKKRHPRGKAARTEHVPTRPFDAETDAGPEPPSV